MTSSALAQDMGTSRGWGNTAVVVKFKKTVKVKAHRFRSKTTDTLTEDEMAFSLSSSAFFEQKLASQGIGSVTVRDNDDGNKHAEVLMVEYMAANNIPVSSVTAITVDKACCADCWGMLGKLGLQAVVDDGVSSTSSRKKYSGWTKPSKVPK